MKEYLDFYNEKTKSLKLEEIEINNNIDELNKQQTTINNQITQLSGAKANKMSEVVVMVDSKIAGTVDFELTYYVANAGWFPSYDIRAKSIAEPIDLVYKANVHQNTKEDWKNIKVRLSSNNPDISGMSPKLKIYFLNYNVSPPKI